MACCFSISSYRERYKQLNRLLRVAEDSGNIDSFNFYYSQRELLVKDFRKLFSK